MEEISLKQEQKNNAIYYSRGRMITDAQIYISLSKSNSFKYRNRESIK